MRSTDLLRRTASVLLLCAPLVALAHPGHEGDHGGLTWDFSSGFGHPLGGLDHLLAMMAVGLWAAQLGGRARWALPAAFLTALAAGAALGANGGVFGGLEQGIAASVLVLGLLVVTAARLPLAAGIILSAVFALFHGVAHGAEMPVDASGAVYGLGFLGATALLHAAGLGLGVFAARAPKWVGQAAGAGLMLAGGWMLAA
jgi:urease accessory protein